MLCPVCLMGKPPPGHSMGSDNINICEQYYTMLDIILIFVLQNQNVVMTKHIFNKTFHAINDIKQTLF